jgi:hypothetical protein
MQQISLGRISRIYSGRHPGSYRAFCFKCKKRRPGSYMTAGLAAMGLKRHLQTIHAGQGARKVSIVGWNQKAENKKEQARKDYRERLAFSVRFCLDAYRFEKLAEALRPLLRKHLHPYDFEKLEQFRRVWRAK